VNASRVDAIADAVLYEGYILYPYRASALKNRHRFNIGVLAPHDVADAVGDRWSARTECLVRGSDEATVNVTVRFLHVLEAVDRVAREDGWQEAVPRTISIDVPLGRGLGMSSARTFDVAPVEGRSQHTLSGTIETSCERVRGSLYRIAVIVSNLTPIDRQSLERDRLSSVAYSLVSAHVVLRTAGAEFLSLLDPPEEVREASAQCCNLGLWPVLVGDEGEHDAMLASPIVLYDHPSIAPESHGDFFDATEMDEMLSLRVLTMTDAEKAEARQTDPRARMLIDRTEALSPDELARLHGVVRGLRPIGRGTSE
jgi:hypothetical protein